MNNRQNFQNFLKKLGKTKSLFNLRMLQTDFAFSVIDD